VGMVDRIGVFLAVHPALRACLINETLPEQSDTKQELKGSAGIGTILSPWQPGTAGCESLVDARIAVHLPVR
jgi:hypothetical protein